MENDSLIQGITLDEQLCFEIYQTHKTFNKFYAQALKPFGLTYVQFIVMLSLYEKETLSVKQLGKNVSLDSGTLTPLLRRLENEGWVTRVRSATDERQLDISPSEAAWKLKPELFTRVKNCQAMLDLPEKKYLKYKKDLQKLKGNIEKVADQLDLEAN